MSSNVPLTNGVVTRGGEELVTTKKSAGGVGVQRQLSWLSANVQQIAVGVLSHDGREGCAASALKHSTSGVKVSLWPKTGATFTELTVAAEGGGTANKSVTEALTMAGARWRAWSGGLVLPALVATAPLVHCQKHEKCPHGQLLRHASVSMSLEF